MPDSLDDSWKLNGRPQSTMAQSFSSALDSAFGIDSSLDGLARTVEQKKQAVSSQNAELEALEARLRATEERLKERQSRSSSPMTGTSRYISPQRRPPVGRTLSNQPNGSPTALRSPPVTGVSSSARPAIAGTKAPSYSVAEMPGAFEPPLETVTSKKNKSTMREGVFCREQ